MQTGIRQRLLAAWKRHPLFTSAFLVMGVVTLFLTVRLVVSIAYWSTHRDQPVEAWMPLGYIARSYSIPVEEMRRMADLPPDIRDRRPIGEIAAARGVEQARFIEQIRAGISRYRIQNKPEQDH